MSDATHRLGLYLHLARASGQRQRPHVRDKMLVLAGVTATQMKLAGVAAFCRQQVLQHNPGHMVRRWSTIAMALENDDFHHYLKQLQRRYPLEKAERMLSTLGIEMARERDTYYNDREYAAALLGVSPQQLDRFVDGSAGGG